MKKYFLIVITFTVLLFSSCLKTEEPIVIPDPLIQLGKDTVIIKKFITDNSIPAIKYDVTGIYYQIKDFGTGDTIPKSSSTVKIKYVGRFLNGTIFNKSDTTGYETQLGNFISGFQLGIPLIRKGGKIRLIIASGYAYGRFGTREGTIPPNTILDFDIELLDVK